MDSSIIMRLKMLRTALQASTCSFSSTGTSVHGSSRKTFAEFVRNTWHWHPICTVLGMKTGKTCNKILVLLQLNLSLSLEEVSCFTHHFTFLCYSSKEPGGITVPPRLSMGFVGVSSAWAGKRRYLQPPYAETVTSVFNKWSWAKVNAH